MKAFISDIHSNIEALTEVMKDIEQHNVSEIICLGDIVGYGPDPSACTELIMQKSRLTIKGNHDHALIHGPIGFNYIAAGAIYINKEMMNPDQKAKCLDPLIGNGLMECCRDRMLPKCFEVKYSKKEHWEFIDKLPESLTEENILYIHGSPLSPTFEYVFPDKFTLAWQPGRIINMFEHVPWLAFCGHTHHPCIIASDLSCYYPEKVDYKFTLDKNKKYLINIGSVGQPRDGDNRSCYMLFDETKGTVEWRRIPYDIQAVVEKINKVCGLDNRCGTRLLQGV